LETAGREKYFRYFGCARDDDEASVCFACSCYDTGSFFCIWIDVAECAVFRGGRVYMAVMIRQEKMGGSKEENMMRSDEHIG